MHSESTNFAKADALSRRSARWRPLTSDRTSSS